MKGEIISGQEAIDELSQKYKNLRWWNIIKKTRIKNVIAALNWFENNIGKITLRRA